MSVPVTKALIPMAGSNHDSLPLQTVLAADGLATPLIRHQIDELFAAGVREVCLVVSEGSHALVAPVLGDYGDRIQYVWQKQPLGFGHALWCARDWAGRDPVLVQVCDHVFLSSTAVSCVRQVAEAWAVRGASVCAVQRLKESEVPRVGVVAGKRLENQLDTYLLEAFLEKPTLTKAELLPHIPGLGSNEYLCSAGIFVVGPVFFDILGEFATGPADQLRWLAPAFTELMRRESLYGLEFQGRRINLEERFGLVRAQLALGLASPDRDALLTLLLEEAVRR